VVGSNHPHPVHFFLLYKYGIKSCLILMGVGQIHQYENVHCTDSLFV
jgi:hypothetical protein